MGNSNVPPFPRAFYDSSASGINPLSRISALGMKTETEMNLMIIRLKEHHGKDYLCLIS